MGCWRTGATAARLLVRGGAKVTVFDKSGGTGGRLSTRRTKYGPFDQIPIAEGVTKEFKVWLGERSFEYPGVAIVPETVRAYQRCIRAGQPQP